jgi:hypothetical protein
MTIMFTNQLPLLRLCGQILELRMHQAPVLRTREQFLKLEEAEGSDRPGFGRPVAYLTGASSGTRP